MQANAMHHTMVVRRCATIQRVPTNREYIMKKILTASAVLATSLLLASCGGPDTGAVTPISAEQTRPAPKETIAAPGSTVKFGADDTKKD